MYFFVGNYYYMTHWNDIINYTAVITVENVTLANQGIYSAGYVGDTPLNGAWMRLIVRGLLIQSQIVLRLLRNTFLGPVVMHSVQKEALEG